MSREIPVFFSTDDNYIPFLDVAIASLIANASKEFNYRIIVLNTGLKSENMARVKQNERPGVAIEFADISERVAGIRSCLKNIYHFSISSYYRIFIASLFPQYDKIIYLDCDLVVLGDISELYNTELGENVLGAVTDQYVCNTKEFRCYAEKAVGVDPDSYFNTGVLLISLEQFRRNNIEGEFIKLISAYDFDLLDPDQAYLNYLCFGKARMLPNGWNKEPTQHICEGEKNILHYALYKKPWQYDDVIDGTHFWKYAKSSPFYEVIRDRRESFSEEERNANDAVATKIILHANKIVASDMTFAKVLGARG